MAKEQQNECEYRNLRWPEAYQSSNGAQKSVEPIDENRKTQKAHSIRQISNDYIREKNIRARFINIKLKEENKTKILKRFVILILTLVLLLI